jgi:2-methylisocitrate lyase-like PEP mutase family enzyme
MVLDLAPDQVAAVRAKVPNTQLAWFTSPSMPAPSRHDLEAAGFKLALFPFNSVAAVAEAVTAICTELRDHGRIRQSPETLAKLRNSVQELIGMSVYWDIEKRSAARADASENEVGTTRGK